MYRCQIIVAWNKGRKSFLRPFALPIVQLYYMSENKKELKNFCTYLSCLLEKTYLISDFSLYIHIYLKFFPLFLFRCTYTFCSCSSMQTTSTFFSIYFYFNCVILNNYLCSEHCTLESVYMHENISVQRYKISIIFILDGSNL